MKMRSRNIKDGIRRHSTCSVKVIETEIEKETIVK